MHHSDLESALAEVETAAEKAMATVAELARVLKQTRAAAATGKLPDMDKALTQARQQIALVSERVDSLAGIWAFDARTHFDSGAYTRELIGHMEQLELAPVERDGRILSYPSILRVIPSDQSIEVDRKKERRVRPSFIAAELKKHRGRKAGMRPEQMIEVLHTIYQPLVATQKGTRVVRALDIYELLTQLPQAKGYSKQEFARDLLQLDMSSVRSTKAGHRLHLRADTGAKGSSVLSAVTPDGEVRIYSGVEFSS